MEKTIYISAKAGRYVLVKLIHIQHGDKIFLKADVIRDPLTMMGSFTFHTEPYPVEEHSVVFLRESSRTGIHYYNSTMTSTDNYIQLYNEIIREYTMTTPNLILPSSFYKVFTGEDVKKRYHFTNPTVVLRPLVGVSLKPSCFPIHIFNSYIESEIQKGTICAITMEPITKENVAMTKCGHCFEKNALATALGVKKICPTCREPLGYHELQMYM